MNAKQEPPKIVNAMEGKKCRYNGFGPCLQGECAHFQVLRGVDFQTGEPILRWDCADNAEHMMSGEQSKRMMEMSEDLHALKQNMHVFVETMLVASNRPDLLEKMRARTGHINALTRTDEIQRRNRRYEEEGQRGIERNFDTPNNN